MRTAGEGESAGTRLGRHRGDVRLPYVALAVSVIALGTGPIFVRAISASPITIAVHRAWLCVPITLLLTHLTHAPLTWSILRRCVAPGVVFAASTLFGFASFQHTSVANATLIGALTPVLVVAVAGPLFAERVPRRSLLFGVVSIAGVILVVLGAGSDGRAAREGDLYSAVSMLLFTGYFLMIKQRRAEGCAAIPLLAGVILVSAGVLTPYALVASNDLGGIDGTDWLWVLGLSLLSGIAGHGLTLWAQRHVPVTISSLLTLAVPVFATLAAWVVYSEALTLAQGMGAAIVLGGLFGVVRSAPRPVADLELGPLE